jgi:hypothetical protein
MLSDHVYPEPAFPTIYRREKDSGMEMPQSEFDDGTISFLDIPTTRPPRPEKKGPSDKLAPMPENRRLGYLSVAALIINKMIGICALPFGSSFVADVGTDRHWHLLDPKFDPDRHRWQQSRGALSVGSGGHHHVSRVSNATGCVNGTGIDHSRSGSCYIWSWASSCRITAENSFMYGWNTGPHA